VVKPKTTTCRRGTSIGNSRSTRHTSRPVCRPSRVRQGLRVLFRQGRIGAKQF
jgi:hypothetical protein